MGTGDRKTPGAFIHAKRVKLGCQAAGSDENITRITQMHLNTAEPNSYQLQSHFLLPLSRIS